MLVIMLWVNWRFALVSLSVAPLLFLTILYHTRRVSQAAREARKSEGLLASIAQETLASIRVVQGFGQERQQNVRFHGQSETSLKAYLMGVTYQARVAPIVDIMAASGLAIVMWYGTTRVLENELSIGDVIVFFAYVTSLYAPMRQLSRITLRTNKASIGAERIADILSQRSDVTDAPGAGPAPCFRGHVRFERVTFGYEHEQPVLDDFSLDVKAGETIALVGSTGAGKSTVASLLLRFYDPQAGRVTIDGRDVRDFTLGSLRDQISLVLQDSLLFSGSVRENIAFGRPDATDAEILAAAIAANADEFIRRMPDGYASSVSERATTLSGGQKQRIAIARAILRESPILILDEPTSGLDIASERTVMAAIQRLARGRTTFIIAHRLATIQFADRIAVLEGGRIVEQGTHATLLERSGAYAELHRV
jgi:subfamily B ATP-binding cassette protein MsbA